MPDERRDRDAHEHASHDTYVERLTVRLHARDEAEGRRRALAIAERLGRQLAVDPPSRPLGLVTLRVRDERDAKLPEEPR
jgi:hypothetical protein